MRFVGDGSDLWHARVDLIAPDGDGSRVSRVAHEVGRLLSDRAPGQPGLGYGVDQGKGIEGQPVLGLTFWVGAEDVGAAAETALATARAAGAMADVGPDYYGVLLVPRSAIRMPEDEHTMDMPD